MSDRAAGVVALGIAAAHVALFVMAWAWAARSRHLGYLALIGPAAVAWVLAGYPLVQDITYGTRALAAPRSGLQTAGLVAILGGFGGFFVCALGSLVTVIVSARRAKPGRQPASPRR